MGQFVKTYAWLLSLVPVGMLVLAVFQFLRTRRKAGWGKVKTSCLFTPNTRHDGGRIVQTGPASLVVEAVNHGAGEVTIRTLKGRYRDGDVRDITLPIEDKKLKQGDRLARAIMPFDVLGEQYDGFYSEAGIELVDMWFEDTFGRKHKLKGVKKYLRAMRELA